MAVLIGPNLDVSALTARIREVVWGGNVIGVTDGSMAKN